MTRGVYYNENNPFAAQWLRNLIGAGLIPKGEVDARSVKDVQPSDLAGFRNCHFFAGVGGWALALDMAGWDRDDTWTGSCPCQPFSDAGKRRGFEDERHLWPDWRRLIAQRRPATIFGEQVARAHSWLALVRRDLVALEYAVGAMPIQASSIGALHQRDRYWFVAHTYRDGQPTRPFHAEMETAQASLPDADRVGRKEWAHVGHRALGSRRSPTRGEAIKPVRWDFEPDMVCLVHGLPGRVGGVHAFGNAIYPQVAAEFVAAAAECMP